MTRLPRGLCVAALLLGCSQSTSHTHTPTHSALPPSTGHTPETDADLGAWEPPFEHPLAGFAHPPSAFHSAHLALIPVGPRRGSVLVWNEPDDPPGLVPTFQQWSVLDVATAPQFANHELAMPTGAGDLFCSGHCWLPSGKLFVAGGTTHYGTEDEPFVAGRIAYTYDPYFADNLAWSRLPDMAADRWYPSATLLASGLVAVTGGTLDTSTASRNDLELFDPSTSSWVSAPGGVRLFDGPATTILDSYPRLHQLASGPLFLSGMAAGSARLSWSGLVPVWQRMDDSFYGYRLFGASVHFAGRAGSASDRIVILGGETFVGRTSFARSSVEEARASSAQAPAWDWTAMPPMSTERAVLNAVVLPDASILAVGGHGNAWSHSSIALPLHAERFDGERWKACASAASPHDYHSAALLLPDGRVLVAGGESRTHDYEIYRPWYLTTGRPRPEIVDVQETLGTQVTGLASFDVLHAELPLGSSIAHAVLMRPGSITHHSDFDARYVRLRTVATSATSVEVEAPLDTRQTPRGWYMLFLVSDERVPSVAKWVKVP